jgi:hypothetical protein
MAGVPRHAGDAAPLAPTDRRAPLDVPAQAAGRPPFDKDVRELILRLARENDRGYVRIAGELRRLGMSVSATLVRNVLARAGVPPAAACGAQLVERVGLPARAALSPRTTDLEHPLVVIEQEPAQTGTVGRGALDRERAPAGSVSTRQQKCFRITTTVRCDAGLEHHHAAWYRDDRDRVRIAVRVDADNEIELICKHHRSTSSPGWGTTPVPVWG